MLKVRYTTYIVFKYHLQLFQHSLNTISRDLVVAIKTDTIII